MIEYLVKELVDEPEHVVINELPGEEATTYEVRVAPGDLGKVIGKQVTHRKRTSHSCESGSDEGQEKGLRRDHRVTYEPR